VAEHDNNLPGSHVMVDFALDVDCRTAQQLITNLRQNVEDLGLSTALTIRAT
jgi:hypothetical protein